MKKNIFKGITVILAPLLILVVMTCFALKKIPDKFYVSSSSDIATFSDALGPLGKASETDEGYNISILGLIPVKSVQVLKVPNLEVIPGGVPVGVRIASNGVLVVGFSDIALENERIEAPAKIADIRVGDVILKYNDENVKNSKDLVKRVKNSKNDKAILQINRDGDVLNKEISLIKENGSEYKLGLWVRDSMAGVGTMTFYDEKSGRFGALGHPITDSDTNKTFGMKNGELFDSSIISVKRGEKGNPGELKGIFMNENTPIGSIAKNTECGIFGTVKEGYNTNAKAYKVGFRDEIKEGKATILTTVDESGPTEYEIEISKLLQQEVSGPKSMVIKVTDPRLLEKTGGIVQGMSGSPIIQNGKIVGAVTHVLINKPDTGYGIYIEWMLQDAGIIK
ncbi:MAG: SpoIVB peptidase [Clostridium sp.]